MATIAPTRLPEADYDIFGDAMLDDPYAGYRIMRDMGSAVRLPRNDTIFIGRYKDVRAALTSWGDFSSASGTGFNPIVNEAWSEALISQDPPAHTHRRKLMTDLLSPVALKPVADTIDARSEALAGRLLAMDSFDGVTDVAHELPVGVVMDLIGWPQDVRPLLIDYAEGSVESVAPPGPRMESGIGRLQAMMTLIAELYDQDRVVPGGLAAQLIAASHRGEIDREAAIGLLGGFIVAAFDTTISAMSSAMWLFALNPDEWRKLRADPDLSNGAATEIVRYESPLQNFGRMAMRDVTLSDGSVVPGGTRVALSLASGNRDERQFERPDRFVIDRREKQNLGFGFGVHMCAGQGLARMELNAVMKALAARIDRFEFVSEPVRDVRITRSFRTLPMRAVAA